MSNGRQKIGLLQSELKVLLESMPEAVFIFSADGVVAETNSAAQKLFGNGLRGMGLTALMQDIAVERGGRPLLVSDSAVSRALRGESIQHEQRVYIRAGAEPLDALITAEPMRSLDGEITGVLVIIRDVTELYDLQRRLEDTERYLAIGQMAADIAHDISNVLSAISQAAVVMERQQNAGDDERRFFLATIQNAARRGAEIIQRMGEYIRGGKGERLPVDVTEILREALDLTRPLLDARVNIELQTGMLLALTVLANAADLRRSFCNIILNAIEAMPQGGVLKISCRREKDCAVIAIEDTGVGITPEARTRIFSPYFTTKAKGTGLGLSGARRIVQTHGGDIRFESEPNRGTKFFVQLPLINNKGEVAA